MARISKSELLALQKKVKTDEAIGERYGITRQAVHQLRNKYGIAPLSLKNVERDRKIITSYKTGVAGTALADTFGLSVSQTYRILAETAKGKKKK